MPNETKKHLRVKMIINDESGAVGQKKHRAQGKKAAGSLGFTAGCVGSSRPGPGPSTCLGRRN